MPAGQAPDHAGKAFELEWLAFPFAAWRSGTIEGTETGVDGALVGLGAEFVARWHELGCIEDFLVSASIG